ncbi:hypothetical protein ACOZ4N_00795 (plasmid) [Halorientalis pallida]|uniref:hypothetical protein n=1 Tax=Halorientalis pallida TaxID=2479928 RepID=UPI003C6F400F
MKALDIYRKLLYSTGLAALLVTILMTGIVAVQPAAATGVSIQTTEKAEFGNIVAEVTTETHFTDKESYPVNVSAAIQGGEEVNGTTDLRTIEVGETRRSKIDASDIEPQGFDGYAEPINFGLSAGDRIDVVANATSDSNIRLFLGSTEDDIGLIESTYTPGNASLVNVTAPKTAPYTVIVLGGANQTFQYSITVRNASLNSDVDTDGDGLTDARERDLGTNATLVDTDGDGLWDGNETELGFDPLDNDSDASSTQSNEAGDGVEDGLEDIDGDGIPVGREMRLGLDPFDADEDDDGLPSGYEATQSYTDPTQADSNDNGVSDGSEDHDGDSLTTAKELNIGSDPQRRDTDDDGLDDDRELAIGTNVSDPDTDNDGIKDGIEASNTFPTNPTNSDTDGDGIPDGEEEVSTKTTNTTLNATATVRGPGTVAGNVTIKNGSRPMLDLGAAGDSMVTSPIKFENQSRFDNATITLPYNELAVSGSEADVSIYRYNETLQTFVAVESNVDKVNNTVSANVSHFSTYTAMDSRRWNERVTGPTAETKDNGETWTIPVYVSSFESGSLNSNWSFSGRSTDPDGDGFGDPINDRGSVGVSGGSLQLSSFGCYRTQADWNYGFSNGSQTTISFDYTRTQSEDYGVHETNFYIRENGSKLDYDVVNGPTYGSEKVLPATTTPDPASGSVTVQAGIENGSFNFGFINEPRLQFRDATSCNLGSLDKTDLKIHRVITKVTFTNNNITDTDGDGLPDFIEERGIPTGWGRVQTNKSNPDTDGDGLTDGQEVAIGQFVQNPNNPGQRYFRLQSDPTTRNSDDDQLTDYTERQMDTNPMRSDTDGDGLDDHEDFNPHDPYEIERLSNADKGRAMLDGAILGAFGEADGAVSSDYYDTPYFVIGEVGGGALPLADVRDAIGHARQDDWNAIIFDIAGAVPAGGDTVKTADTFAGWAKRADRRTVDWLLETMQKYEIIGPKRSDEFNKIMLRRIIRAGQGAEDFKNLARITERGGQLVKLKNSLPRGMETGEIERAYIWPDGALSDEVYLLLDSRWTHIKERHYTGERQPDGITKFFPSGETVPAGSSRSSKTLPNEMSTSELKELIKNAIENGNRDGAITTYEPSGEYGIDQLRLVANHDRGWILGLYAQSGPNVYEWNGTAWVENPDPNP